VVSESPQQISRVLVPNIDAEKSSGKQMGGVKSERIDRLSRVLESSQQTTSGLVPDFDGLVIRTAGKHATRVESHCRNPTRMASEVSQQIARVLVPKHDSVVMGTTG